MKFTLGLAVACLCFTTLFAQEREKMILGTWKFHELIKDSTFREGVDFFPESPEQPEINFTDSGRVYLNSPEMAVDEFDRSTPYRFSADGQYIIQNEVRAKIEILNDSVLRIKPEEANFSIEFRRMGESIAVKHVKLQEVFNGDSIKILDPVTVSTNVAGITLNPIPDCRCPSLVSNGGLTEIAQRFVMPKFNSKIKQIRISKTGYDARFKVHLLQADPVTGFPGKEILDSALTIFSSKRTAIINFDSAPPVITDSVFFVGIEWIIDEENKRVRSHRDERRMKNTDTLYAPFIRFEHSKNFRSIEAFQKYVFKEGPRWMRYSPAARFLISVTVE